jgi:hypothetical protein
MAARRAAGIVEKATRADLARLPDELAGSGLAMSAVVMARILDDPEGSFTSKSMCQARLQDALDRLRELAPVEEARDGIDDLTQRRAQRRAGGAGA